MPAGQLFAQGELGFIRGFGPDIPDAVADSVDMGVHADGGLPETLHQQQVGGFAPYAGKFQERIQIVGDVTLVLLNDDPADFHQTARFGGIKPDRVNELLNLVFTQGHDLFRGLGPGKKPLDRLCGDLVFGSQRQQGGNQDLERGCAPLGDTGNYRWIPLPVIGFNRVDKTIDVELFSGCAHIVTNVHKNRISDRGNYAPKTL